MKNNKIYLILLIIILIIGGCALKDKIIGKESLVVKETDNLQLYLKFDATTIEDLSNYANIITKEGNFAYANGYYKFDGESTYIKVNKDFNKNKELSIGFWINPDQRKSAFILSNGPTDNVPSLYMFYENVKRIKFNHGRESRFTGQDIINNKWTFVFFTSNGSETTIYVNGVKDNTYSQDVLTDTNHTEFYIGKGYECTQISSTYRCSDSYFSGYLDELRIYDKVLSEEEIKLLYEETKKS